MVQLADAFNTFLAIVHSHPSIQLGSTSSLKFNSGHYIPSMLCLALVPIAPVILVYDGDKGTRISSFCLHYTSHCYCYWDLGLAFKGVWV